MLRRRASSFNRLVEPGEVVPPGAGLFTLGQLDDLTITVYVPEDRYGTIDLGETARVTVDSFPGETFTGKVIEIADRAEFTRATCKPPKAAAPPSLPSGWRSRTRTTA